MIVQTTFHVLEVRISMYVGRSEVIQAIKFLMGRTTVFEIRSS